MNSPKGDIILDALKAAWFSDVTKENYPKTPALSKRLDDIEAKINERKTDLLTESVLE